MTEFYRGIKIEADQSPERLRFIRAEIDRIIGDNRLIYGDGLQRITPASSFRDFVGAR
jgi:hypothetical protein